MLEFVSVYMAIANSSTYNFTTDFLPDPALPSSSSNRSSYNVTTDLWPAPASPSSSSNSSIYDASTDMDSEQESLTDTVLL